MLRAGDHVVAGDDLYGGTYRIFERVMKQMGIEVTYVDPTSADRVRRGHAADDQAGLGGDADQPAAQAVRHRRRRRASARSSDVWLAVDNTFLTPMLQRPLELGATMVVHSTTKYLNGHADVVGGAVVTRDDEVHERLSFLQNAIGAVPSPMDCFLVLRGTKTLHVRMERHVENARKVAAWLEAHPAVEKVIYPGLDVASAARARRAADARPGRHDLVRLEERPRSPRSSARAPCCARRSCSPAPSRWAASSRSSSTRRS